MRDLTRLTSLYEESFIDLENSELHNESQLTKFISSEGAKDLPLDRLQYRVYVKRNYNEQESLIVFKINHCIIDGIGSFLLAS